MRIPSIFVPKNEQLEKKTEQLFEGPKIAAPEPELPVEKSDLEEILNDLYNPDYSRTDAFHSKMGRLLEKNNYVLTFKKRHYEYWCKPDPFNLSGSHVFIQKYCKDGRRDYSFAKVENDNLERFCKVFERCYLLDSCANGDILADVGYYGFFTSLIASGIGGGAGLVYLSKVPVLSISSALIFPFGALAGVIVGGISFFAALYGGSVLTEKLYNNYKEKTKGFYKGLVIKDEQAIRAAFVR